MGGLSDRYIAEFGENAYAVFNAATDFASHPPANRFVCRERHSLQRLAGRWLSEFSEECQAKGAGAEAIGPKVKDRWKKTDGKWLGVFGIRTATDHRSKSSLRRGDAEKASPCRFLRPSRIQLPLGSATTSFPNPDVPPPRPVGKSANNVGRPSVVSLPGPLGCRALRTPTSAR